LIRTGELLVHIDFESGPDEFLARRMLLYNVLAHHRTGFAGANRRRLVALERPANEPCRPSGIREAILSVRYHQAVGNPAEELLQAGVGLLPLTVLGRPPKGMTREQALPGQVERIAVRIEAEASHELGKLMTATYILSGMHNNAQLARAVFSKMMAMRESGTYRLILEEGAIEHTHDLILRLDRERFGNASEKQVDKLRAIQDLARLDRLAIRLMTVKSWDSLLRGR
jgi:hypothetical protein